MPRKIRELIRDLKKAGFTIDSGKGSHRKFIHQKIIDPVTLSGNEGKDAKPYQERAVKKALERLKDD